MQVSFFHYQLCPDIIASSGIGFVLRPANVFVRKRSANVATAKGFYLRESEAAAATGFCLCESEAAAATTRCRSVSRYRMDAMVLG